MKEKINEMIEKYNLTVGYKMINGEEVEGIAVGKEMSEQDLKFARDHKPEILKELKAQGKSIRENFRKEMEEKEKQRRIEKFAKEIEESKKTGKKVFCNQWMEACNDPEEECNTDLCMLYVLAKGNDVEFSVTRQHTW